MAESDETLPTRVLSGIQPSGMIHLGNYFGAIEQHVALQNEFPEQSFYFIADYHALTSLRDADALRENVFELAVTYLACGLDPTQAVLFRQSDIPEVTELAWMLSTVTGVGLLERAHSYKDKVSSGIKPVTGLFFYPVLMAADILLYRSSLVPVGKDQVQHLEMTQDMATHFNQAFAGGQPVLRRPQWRLSRAPYVPGIDGRKMSKSYGNMIPLFASGKALKKIVGQIVTDSTPLGQPLKTMRIGDDGQEVKETIYALLELLCDDEQLEQIRGFYRTGQRDGQAYGWGHAKQQLAAKIEEHFAPMRARAEHFRAHPEQVEQILTASAARARVIARETLDTCRRVCGLR